MAESTGTVRFVDIWARPEAGVGGGDSVAPVGSAGQRTDETAAGGPVADVVPSPVPVDWWGLRPI